MARLRSGILGNIRGKVAGVVGSQWKDVNYVREYVKPANPNTAAQIVQRDKMAAVVSFCKALVGPVFNAYTDKFQKSMSGFNFFIKRNIDVAFDEVAYHTVKMTEGKLFAAIISAAPYDTGAQTTTIAYNADLGNNGADDDAVYAALYDSSSGIWYFASAEVDRDVAEIVIVTPAGLTAANLHAYVFCIQYSGTLVNIISNSDYHLAAVA